MSQLLLQLFCFGGLRKSLGIEACLCCNRQVFPSIRENVTQMGHKCRFGPAKNMKTYQEVFEWGRFDNNSKKYLWKMKKMK